MQSFREGERIETRATQKWYAVISNAAPKCGHSAQTNTESSGRILRRGDHLFQRYCWFYGDCSWMLSIRGMLPLLTSISLYTHCSSSISRDVDPPINSSHLSSSRCRWLHSWTQFIKFSMNELNVTMCTKLKLSVIRTWSPVGYQWGMVRIRLDMRTQCILQFYIVALHLSLVSFVSACNREQTCLWNRYDGIRLTGCIEFL